MDILNKANPKLILFLGVLGVSLSAIFVKYSDAPSLITATYRLAWTVAILAPLSLKKSLPEIRRFSKKEVFAAIAAGILFALHFTLWFESLKHTTIASSTVLVDTDVIFAAIGFCIFMHGRIPKKGVLAIIVTVCGGVITALSGGGEGTSSLFGNMLALAAAILIAGYTLLGRFARSRNISTSAYTLITYTACLITLLILDFATGTPVTGYGIKEVLIGLGLAVFCNLLGHSIVSWSLKYLTPAYISAVKLCEPVFATLLGIVFFREIPNALQILGAAVIIGGVYVYSSVENAASESITEEDPSSGNVSPENAPSGNSPSGNAPSGNASSESTAAIK